MKKKVKKKPRRIRHVAVIGGRSKKTVRRKKPATKKATKKRPAKKAERHREFFDPGFARASENVPASATITVFLQVQDDWHIVVERHAVTVKKGTLAVGLVEDKEFLQYLIGSGFGIEEMQFALRNHTIGEKPIPLTATAALVQGDDIIASPSHEQDITGELNALTKGHTNPASEEEWGPAEESSGDRIPPEDDEE